MFGEHAVVHAGFHAVLWPVRSVGARVTVVDKSSSAQSYSVERHGSIPFTDIQQQLAKARDTYLLFEKNDDISVLSPYKDPVLYTQICVAIAHEYVQNFARARSLVLAVDSNIPVGGFGSSAAVAAGIIKAVIAANNLALDQKTWLQLVMQAEKLQHGKPSGGDSAVVTLNQPIVVKNKQTGGITIEPLDEVSTVRSVMESTQLVYTGTPSQSTGEVIKYVSAHARREEIFDSIEANTKRAITYIKNNSLTLRLWKQLINTNGLLLEELGVLPTSFIDFSARIRASSGAIKVSGAGALSGANCGAMLAVSVNPFELTDFDVYTLR